MESKEALLFEWLMELYQALLSHVDLINTRRLTPAQRLTALFESHLLLHESMTRRFKLDVMDASCQSAPMEESIRQLKEAYESQILSLIGQLSRQLVGALRGGALKAILPMLNSLPIWLSSEMDNLLWLPSER